MGGIRVFAAEYKARIIVPVPFLNRLHPVFIQVSKPVFIQSISSTCNMACHYCFYRDEAEKRQQEIYEDYRSRGWKSSSLQEIAKNRL